MFILKLRRNIPRWVIIFTDLILQVISLIIAYLIRFDLKADLYTIKTEWTILSKSIIFYFSIKLCIFYYFKIHKGLIRHTSTEDIKRIFFANIICSGLFLLFGIIRSNYFDGFYLFPSSVLIMEFFVSLFILLSFRLTVKFIYTEAKLDLSDVNVLIYGSGILGQITKETLERDKKFAYNVVAFIDDNPKLNNNRLLGLSIFHTSKIEKIVNENQIKKIVLAIQTPNQLLIKPILDYCLDKNIEVLQVPNQKSWINQGFTSKQISKIKIEDLLGRNPIQLNKEGIQNELQNQAILVTGAAGSIGSGLVKEIANYNPGKLILLDQAESPMYELEFELKTNYPDLKFEVVIGDIRNYNRMSRMFAAYQPIYIFHAAAYKHVPLMEDNPSEAINTNVLGTYNLVNLAKKYSVRKFVMISTDKAVNPTNVMGASKRIAEIYAQTQNSEQTRFITTRFGNVLGSNGSVIPIFKKQIEAGGPITVTDPEITRFFMTIPEACQLVLEAANMGKGGEIFVFDMGKSVKIIDLAKKMIKLSGLELGKDIEIKFTGLRPGEKLYEELLAAEENTLPTHHPQILVAKERTSDVSLITKIESLIGLFDSQDNFKIVAKMKELVPEFISNNSEFSTLDN